MCALSIWLFQLYLFIDGRPALPICASLFGRTEHLVMAVDAPMREIGDADDPEAAVRMLLDNT